jgi:hypothetical protein
MTVFRPDASGGGTTRVATDVNVRDFLDLFLDRLAAAPRPKQ